MAIEVTPTPGEKIQQAVLGQVSGLVAVHAVEPGYCLRNLRYCVASAFGMSDEAFWAHFVHTLSDDHPTPIKSYWAKDMQRSLRNTPGVEQVHRDGVRGGDLYFNWKLATEGHCGVLLSGWADALVLENTGSQRGVKVQSYNRLSRIDEQPYPEAQEFFRILEV